MGKTNGMKLDPMDLLLLPTWVHKKISVKYKGLLIAFLFVGMFDFIFNNNLIEANFFSGNIGELIVKFILFLLFSLILGAVDVICTMIPISEFAMFIGKRSEKFVSSRFFVVMMKSYAISHLVFLIPYTAYIYSGVNWGSIDMISSFKMRLLYALLAVIIYLAPFFQLGILYRTISTRTRIQLFGKLILVLATYFWMQISSGAIHYMTSLFYNLIL